MLRRDAGILLNKNCVRAYRPACDTLGYRDYCSGRTTLFDVFDFDQMEAVDDIVVKYEEFNVFPASKNIQTLLKAPKSRERLRWRRMKSKRKLIIVDPPPSSNVLTDNGVVATRTVVVPEKLNANSL